MILHGDIKLNNDGLLIRDGDLVLGEAIEQHLSALMQSTTGNFRQHPTLGANLLEEVDAPSNARNVLARVSETLFMDGWRLDNLELDTVGENLTISVVDAVKVTDNTNSRI